MLWKTELQHCKVRKTTQLRGYRVDMLHKLEGCGTILVSLCLHPIIVRYDRLDAVHMWTEFARYVAVTPFVLIRACGYTRTSNYKVPRLRASFSPLTLAFALRAACGINEFSVNMIYISVVILRLSD